MLVTHDRYMLEKICNKLLVFENNRIRRHEYGLAGYLKESKGSDSTDITDDGLTREEAQMIIENRISKVLGKLSELEEGTGISGVGCGINELIRKRNKYKD